MSPLGSVDMLVLDMDGVLVDTTASFNAAVIQCARACTRGSAPEEEGDEERLEKLRLCGGFNNDWDAAAAMALLAPVAGRGEEWDRLCRRLAARGGGPDSVRAECGEGRWREVFMRVVPLFQRLYAGDRAAEVYGADGGVGPGLWRLERPLITPEEMEASGLPFGVFTGRTPGEAALGLELLALALPPERLLCDTGPRYRKPRPDGLLELVRVLGGTSVLYVGDSLDDLGAWGAAARQGLAGRFAGIAPPGSEREARMDEGGATFVRSSLREILDELPRPPIRGRR
jgi:HAD superfamily hydrolase (TIGR01548 family)